MSQILNWLGISKSSHSNEMCIQERLVRVRQYQQCWSDLSDSGLKEQLNEIRVENRGRQDNFDSDLELYFDQAAALGALAVQRIKKFDLHDVQIQGALATANGYIIQMNTGEGKTLVCGLASLIRSTTDASVHVATTNAYLAERDHAELEPIFSLLGTTSAFIGLDSQPGKIRSAYRCNITYAPGYMFGFDYLKDQIQLREYESTTLGRDVLENINGEDFSSKLSQTNHNSIIVDEADSVLIDESTTPMLLSGPPESSSDSSIWAFKFANEIVSQLTEPADYTVDSVTKKIELTVTGVHTIHEILACQDKLELYRPWSEYVSNALYARHFLICDENYVVADGKVKLVDQNTGRIFDDRSLRSGLHQALEAKEGLQINPPNVTVARITRQRFFQLYNQVCGLTGTAIGCENELAHFYDSKVKAFQPNIPCKRILHPDRFFKDWDSKLAAIVEDIEQRRTSGQPILVGTRTIRESILIDDALKASGIDCQVLNGVQNEMESELIADAGQVGKITIATNMAGRGTDIKLSDEARSAGGLHVIGSQRFESRRVDRQLAGRSARQGDPGSCQFFISADDQLLEEHSSSLAQKIVNASVQNGNCSTDFSNEIEQLQATVEIEAFEQRKKLVRQEVWFDEVRETVAG